MAVAAIILAAGASRRLGQPKQLLEFHGEPLLERTLRMAAESGAEPVLAVLGPHFAAICAAVQFSSAIPVYNEQWELGMSASIHAGMNELSTRAPQSDGVLLMTCDQPRLTAEHLRGLLGLFAAQSPAAIVASSYAGTKGTPAIFPRAAFARLLALRGDKGARSVIAEPPCAVVMLPFKGGEVDIDSPGDLARYGAGPGE